MECECHECWSEWLLHGTAWYKFETVESKADWRSERELL